LAKNSGNISNQRVNQPDTVIRKVNRQDAELLADLGRRAFYEAFSGQTAPQDMKAYLRGTFSIDKIQTELDEQDSLYLIADLHDNPAGYAYLSKVQPPACIDDPDAIQLTRLYLLRKCYGLGVGNSLMRACLDESRARGFQTVWLSSWELNDRANAFYDRWNFKAVGRQKFSVGNDIQNDVILKRDLVWNST
jgi:predicted N-acetyltransferase YhbS